MRREEIRRMLDEVEAGRSLPLIAGAAFYTVAPTADVTTSASANTLVDHLRALTVAAAECYFMGGVFTGKGQAQATLTGIELQLIRYTTPSTVGAAITPTRAEPQPAVAANTTFFTGPTAGTTVTLAWAGGMMSSGVGYFTLPDLRAGKRLASGGGANGNMDLESSTEGTVGLNFKYTLDIEER